MGKMKSELTTTEARKDLARVVDAAYAKARRMVLTRNGRRVAAIVPIEDLETLERLEDEDDVKAVRKAKKEQGKEDPRSWEDVKRELGLG